MESIADSGTRVVCAGGIRDRETFLSHDNFGSQTGHGGVNVGVGDFRGAHVNIHNTPPPGPESFSVEDLDVQRHAAFFRGRVVSSESLGVFSIVTGVASIAGLYFTLFQGFPTAKYASWSSVFLFSFAVAVTCFVLKVVLKRRRFESFPTRRVYSELGNRGGVYMSTFTATCPWCRSQMNLRNVGPKDGPRDDVFICERNPVQHRVSLDPTCLPEIDEVDAPAQT